MSQHEPEHDEQAERVEENTDVDPQEAGGQVDPDETDVS